MSDTSKKNKTGESEPGELTLEGLLEDIDSEEARVAQEFPDIMDVLDDDLDDLDEFLAGRETDDPDDDLNDDLDDDLDDDLGDDLDDDPEYEPTADRTVIPGPVDSAPQQEPADFQWESAPVKKRWIEQHLPIIVIGLLVIIIIILLLQNCSGAGRPQSDDSWYDTSAVEGTLPGKTPEEIQDMLNQIVEEGMFNISIAPVIAFENPQAQGQARIENIPANHYNMSVQITLDDTSETVYQSKGIRPGQYIEYITLDKQLAPGEYNATALFSAYDPQNLSKQGQVAVKVLIIIE